VRWPVAMRHPARVGAGRLVMALVLWSRGAPAGAGRAAVALIIDSRTARRHRLSATRRDVFLDNRQDPDAIGAQLDRLAQRARRRGSALGIAHPHPETLSVLAQELPSLAARGVRLVSVSELIHLQTRRRTLWHAFSFPSLKVVKSSKP
jgi:hypothetical protein